MTSKLEMPKTPKNQRGVSHPGMMGDGTQEQSLGERRNTASRIKKREVRAAFGNTASSGHPPGGATSL